MKRFVLLAFFAGCAHSTIGDTDIRDTQENREILQLVREYRDALQSLDADAVLELVSETYYESNANSSDEDDYDYHQLAQSLHEDFSRTRRMRVDVRVDMIEVDDDDAYAEIFYEIRAQNDYPSGLKWESRADRTRLRFRRENGRWLLTAGL
ncbi:MAG: nuclear transport factor 2 family protein [Myxococcota bacterium]